MSEEKLSIADELTLAFDDEMHEKFPELSQDTLNRICGLTEMYIRRCNSATWEKADEFHRHRINRLKNNISNQSL